MALHFKGLTTAVPKPQLSMVDCLYNLPGMYTDFWWSLITTFDNLFRCFLVISQLDNTTYLSAHAVALTLSPPIPLKLYTLQHWSNPIFLIFDTRTLWRSGLSARVPECQKLKILG